MSGFWSSDEAMWIKHRQRRLRTLRLRLDGEPRRPRGERARTQDRELRRLIAEELDKRNRRPLRGPVAVSLFFCSGPRNQSRVESLVKAVVDAFWVRSDERAVYPTPLLDHEDDQIKYLHAMLGKTSGQESPCTYITVRPLGDIAADYRFASRLLGGAMFAEDDEQLLFPSLDEPDSPDPGDLRAFSQSWNNWFLEHHKYLTQESLLAKSDAHLLRQLLREPFRIFGVPARDGGDQGGIHDWREVAWSQLVDSLALTLPPLPAADFPGEAFNQRLEEALNTVSRERPVMYPLLAPARLTMLVVPPEDGQTRDLDNMALRVLPCFRSSFLLGEAEESPLAFASKKIDEFQVVWLDRRDSDPPDGILRILMGSGHNLKCDWERVGDYLDRKESY